MRMIRPDHDWVKIKNQIPNMINVLEDFKQKITARLEGEYIKT